jgi:endoglucanase
MSLVFLGLLAPLLNAASVPSAVAAEPQVPNGIKVSRNQLLNGDGHQIRLIGVNRSGTEFACVRGWGVFDGPADTASIQIIRAWHANAVRIGLNEDCWLGINGVTDAYAGARYQQAVADFVNNLNQHGLYVILDLHWSAPGSAPATSLRQMPDADHSITFWQSVATAFVDNPNVLFEVFNEPFGVDWDCWRDGCVVPGGPDTGPWPAVGMQSMVGAIRATGASQPILLGGLAFANDVSEWRTHAPDDPLQQLVAAFHVYPFNPCKDPACWDDEVAPLANAVPLLVSEFGTDWTPPYSDAMALDLMRWADDLQLGYLAWTWNTWGGGDALLTNYSGESTSWGTDFKVHVAQVAVPRARLLGDANAAYARRQMHTAINLYQQVADAPPSEDESRSISEAVGDVGRLRAIIGLTAIGEEEQARHQLTLLVERDPAATLARLATQFWDQYGMTGSARAACAQLAPQVESQAGALLNTLASVGVQIRHDELCVIP